MQQRIRRKQRSCIDVTGPLSLVSCLARFCTHPEVKFHVFDRLKRGEEKSIANLFFDFHTRTTRRFNQANKKKSVIYTLKKSFFGKLKLTCGTVFHLIIQILSKHNFKIKLHKLLLKVLLLEETYEDTSTLISKLIQYA